MLKTLLVAVFLLVPSLSHAETLTRAELLDLYVKMVPSELTAQRIGQLLNLIPAGSGKTTAHNTLKNDILNAVLARRAAVAERFTD